MLDAGDKVLIAHRRLFAEDQPRFFVGTVVVYQDGIAKVRGWSWVREQVRGELRRKRDERTKLVAVGSGSVIVYQLPESVDTGALAIEHGHDQEVVLGDGAGFRMDLTDRMQTVHLGNLR